MRNFLKKLLACLAVSSIFGCGGGGDDTSSKVDVIKIKGILAVGAAVPDVVVAAKCKNSDWVSQPTKANGAFEFLVADSVPCILSAQMADGATYKSMAVLAGVANITPLTDLIFRISEGQPQKVAQATSFVMNNLPKIGVDLYENPISTEFVANGIGLDLAIEQYVEKAEAAGLSGVGSNLKVVDFSNEWVSQCAGNNLCVPIQSMLPSVPQGISAEDKSWWASTFAWAEEKVLAVAGYSKSMIGALTAETHTAYVEGYLSEQSSKLNDAYKLSLQGGSDFYDGKWGDAGIAFLNNMWASVETGLGAVDFVEKPFRIVCLSVVREKWGRGVYLSESDYQAARLTCEAEGKLLSAAFIVKDIKDVSVGSIDLYKSQRSNIKNGIKHLVDNAGGWRTRAINNGFNDYAKHLYGLSKSSIMTNAAFDVQQKLGFLSDTYGLYEDMLVGMGMSSQAVKDFLGYDGVVAEVSPVGSGG